MIIEKSPLTPQQYEMLHDICTVIFIHRNLPLYNTGAFLCMDIVHLNQLFPARSSDKNVTVYLQNML